jgi:hypothetical protein
MGAVFFCLMMGVAISPAFLGAAMNATYAETLAASLPEGLKQVADEATMASLVDSQVLLSKQKMAELEGRFMKMGSEGQALFRQTVDALRTSMEAGLRGVFWIGALTMLAAFLLIITIPEVPIGTEAPPE